MYISLCKWKYNVLTEADNFLLSINFPMHYYQGVPTVMELVIYMAKDYIFNPPAQIKMINGV